MPTYEFLCQKCNEAFALVCSITEYDPIDIFNLDSEFLCRSDSRFGSLGALFDVADSLIGKGDQNDMSRHKNLLSECKLGAFSWPLLAHLGGVNVKSRNLLDDL